MAMHAGKMLAAVFFDDAFCHPLAPPPPLVPSFFKSIATPNQGQIQDFKKGIEVLMDIMIMMVRSQWGV